MAENAGIANAVAARSQVLTNFKDTDLPTVRALVGIIDGQDEYVHCGSINAMLYWLGGPAIARLDACTQTSFGLSPDSPIVLNGHSLGFLSFVAISGSAEDSLLRLLPQSLDPSAVLP